MLIVVVSQGKQQAALKGPKGASSVNQGRLVELIKTGRSCLHVVQCYPAVLLVSSGNPTAMLLLLCYS